MNAKSGKKPEVKPVVTTAQTKEAEVSKWWPMLCGLSIS